MATIHLATDHAGFALKEEVKGYLVATLQYEVHDWGAYEYDAEDDFPAFIHAAATAVAASQDDRAIIFGGSGQGEAMMANRVPGVRATVFYGHVPAQIGDSDAAELSIVAASRQHNNANVLSLGARYLTSATAKAAVADWLSTEFSGAERHRRRIAQLDALTK